MIVGIFHEGSGLGNQLHRYVMAKTMAHDKGIDFGMMNVENFKGASFMNLDMGEKPAGILYGCDERSEKNEDGNEVRDYDLDFAALLKDNTRIDGEFQGEKYYEHRLDEIRDWLHVEPLEVPDDVCVIAFRGGEYVGVPDLFLPQDYWDRAISNIREHGIEKFRVVTDDIETAREFFPNIPIISHEIGHDWRSIRYAKWLILSNSSFGILPALLGDAKVIYAPKFWAGHNKGYWQLKQNQYKRFTYI